MKQHPPGERGSNPASAKSRDFPARRFAFLLLFGLAATARSGPAPTPTPISQCFGLPTQTSSPLNETKVLASDRGELDDFGNDIAVAGRRLVVGAPMHDDLVEQGGAVYIHDDISPGGDWSARTETKLLAPTTVAFGRFGFSVALSGDTLVVGQPALGRIHIYQFAASVWSLRRTIQRPGTFAFDVEIDGGTIVVGARDANIGGGVLAGKAHIFFDTSAGNDWSSFGDVELVGTGTEHLDGFGLSVDIEGRLVAVGAWQGTGADAGRPDDGRAYVYEDTSPGGDWSAFTETIVVPLCDPNDHMQFGRTVALSGATLAVGANSYAGPPGSFRDGAVFVYTAPFDSDVLTIISEADFAGPGTNFSMALDLRGSTMIVGAQGNGCAEGSGAAYIIEDTSGTGRFTTYEWMRVCPSDPWPAGDDRFGNAVRYDGLTLAVGSDTHQNEPGIIDPGAVYLYQSAVATPSPTAAPGCCPGDADNSGSFVDAADFIAVQANFGADNGLGGPGDADCSGSFVDAADFIAVQANFGGDCG